MNSEREIRENLSAVYRPELSETEKEVLEEIDLLAMQNDWSYLTPEYRLLAEWTRPGIFAV